MSIRKPGATLSLTKLPKQRQQEIRNFATPQAVRIANDDAVLAATRIGAAAAIAEFATIRQFRLEAPANDNQSRLVELTDPVADRMERAAITLRRLPVKGLRPADLKCAWPDVVHDFWEAYAKHSVGPIRITPSAADIQQMDEVLGWLFWLDAYQRKVAWSKACGFSYRRLGRLLGRHHATIKVDHLGALLVIALKLETTHLTRLST